MGTETVEEKTARLHAWKAWLASMTMGLNAKRFALLCTTALTLVLVFPLAGLDYLAWVALVPLLFALEGLPGRTVFFAAFLTFLLSRGGTLYWLVYTMNHYGYIPFPVAVLILLLLVGTMGVLWGFTFWGVRRFTVDGGLPLALCLPVAWVAQEWLQTWFLSGFPWAYLGYAPYKRLLLVQSADLFGVWGLSFLIVLVNVAVFEAARWLFKKRETIPVGPVTAACLCMAANLAYGAVRIGQVETVMSQSEPFKVAVLQGNVDQKEKWRDLEVRKATPRMYRDMAVKANEKGDLSLIILPETALPVWQDRDKPLRRSIARFGTKTGTYVLVGCPTKGYDSQEMRVNYNSACLVSPEGKSLGWYHKNRLVPFGEYIPFKDFLRKILGGMVKGTGNFRSWGRYSLMEIPEGPFGVMICYETIFPNLIRSIVNQGAVFLPNITNDAWFGNTSAPHQHLAMVAFRAIENRLYIPRAANTGISGIVEPTGRIVHRTNLYVPDMYTGEIRPMRMQTLYRRFGDLSAYICAALFVCMALFTAIRVRGPETKRRKAL